MTKQLANIGLLEGVDNVDESGSIPASIAQTAALRRDESRVERISADAPDLSLSGLIRKPQYKRPAMVARELKELNAGSKSTLPLFRQSGGYQDAGWYEISSASVEPSHPEETDVWRWSLELTRSGTRGGAYRELRVNPQTLSHPFGNATDKLVAIPEEARKVQWYDAKLQTRAPASATGTVETVVGTLDQYDVDAGQTALSNPTRLSLIYDIPYDADADGVRAYDTRDTDTKTDVDDQRQWQTIHDTQHDVDSPIVLSSMALRLRVTEPDTSATGTLTAERYSNGSWSAVSLPDTTWDPLDLDVIEIGQHRLVAQLLFDDGSDLYAVDIVLELGMTDAFVTAAQDESDPIPSGLQDHLDPIATTTEVDLATSRDVVLRSNVRR